MISETLLRTGINCFFVKLLPPASRGKVGMGVYKGYSVPSSAPNPNRGGSQKTLIMPVLSIALDTSLETAWHFFNEIEKGESMASYNLP